MTPPGGATRPEQVAAFRVERATLFGYMEAAHRVARERVARLTPEQLEQTVAWGTAETPLSPGPAWRVLIVLLNDSIQHTGQINYIRGLVSEPDWRRRAEDASRAADLGRIRSFTWITRSSGEASEPGGCSTGCSRGCPRTHGSRSVACDSPRHGEGLGNVARASRRPFPFRKQSEQVPNEVRLGSNGSSMLLAILGLSCRLSYWALEWCDCGTARGPAGIGRGRPERSIGRRTRPRKSDGRILP